MEPEVHLAFIRGRVKPKGVGGEEEEKLFFVNFFLYQTTEVSSLRGFSPSMVDSSG